MEVSVQIKEVFAKNQLSDLNKFITTLATGYNFQELTWVGIGLNIHKNSPYHNR